MMNEHNYIRLQRQNGVQLMVISGRNIFLFNKQIQKQENTFLYVVLLLWFDETTVYKIMLLK